MNRETGLDIMTNTKRKIRSTLSKSTVSPEEEWRIPYLGRLLQERLEALETDWDSVTMDDLVDMVCSSTFG